MTIKASRANNEFGHIEGEETVAIETARIPLRKHKSLSNSTLRIDMAEIGPCKESVVTT